MSQRGPSILLVHEFPGGFGGAERYLELLGSGLTAEGLRVAAVIFIADADAAAHLGARLSGVAPDTTIVTGRSRFGPIRDAVRAHAPDVVHWNFIEPYAFWGASLLLPPWGRPLVITDHLPQGRHAGPHWETLRRLANRRIRSMIVVGNAALSEAEDRWRRPPPLAVIPNGIRVGEGSVRFAPDPGSALRLVFVGRLTDQKGVRHLVPILSAIRATGIDASLRIVGEGPLAGDVRAAVDGAGMADRVAMVGFSSDPRGEMDRADALLAPSTLEGLPFTPLEALGSGLPLVLSDIPPHRELTAEQSGPGIQLVAQPDCAGWVEAVRRIRDDLPAASADALARAEDHRLEHMIERTIAVYRQVTQ